VRRIESLASDSQSLQVYLREIAKFPKLTTDQERELGRRIQQLSDADALGALVESNLRFVVSYANRYRKLGIPVLELIHEGNLGLLEGARRFDPDRSGPFLTHAAWWVRQSILHVVSETFGVAALETGFELGVADASEVDRADDATLAATPLYEAPRARGLELADVLPDLSVQEIEDDLMRDALVQQIECAMTELNPRERHVMRLRYGLHRDNALSVQQIADRLRLKRDRVRKIEARAQQRLRRGTSLRAYLN
jgi:RNA polymerase primary sigma factor